MNDSTIMNRERARRWAIKTIKRSPIKTAYSQALDYSLKWMPDELRAGLSDKGLLPYELRSTMLELGLLPQSQRVTPDQIRSWLRTAHEESATQDLAGLRVLVFACIPYWIDFMTAISAVLVSRGCHVELAWMANSERFTAPDPKSFTRWVRWRYSIAFADKLPRFRAFEISGTPSRLPPEAEHYISELALADTRYALRAEDLDIENNAEHRHVHEFRRARLETTYGLLRREFDSRKPDVFLTPNGAVLEFGAAWQAARDAGVLTTSFESWDRWGTAVASIGRRCVEIDSASFWQRDEPHVLDDARRQRVEQRIEEREGTAWRDYAFQCQYAERTAPADLYARLELDPKLPVVLVCTNVPWDAVCVNRRGLYETMSDWLRALLKHFEHRADCQVVVRAHPAEVLLDPKQTCEDTLRGVLPELPAHIKFIAPGTDINTYSLMRIAQLGMVFNSTTGLEMAMRGVPVVMPVEAHYTDKGFTIDPTTEREYFAAIDARLAQGTAAPPLTKEQVRLAWCYFDLYTYSWPRQFPWHLSSFKEDMERWPIERVASGEGLERFGETFALLAGRA